MATKGLRTRFCSILVHLANGRASATMFRLYATGAHLVYTVCQAGKSQGLARGTNALNQNIENRIENLPHINFTWTTTGFWFWNRKDSGQEEMTEKLL